MRTPRHFAPTECASTARCPSASPTHRATRRRRQAEARDRPSFQHPNPVAQICRELELLAFDRTTQTIFELSEHCCSLERLRHRGTIGATNVSVVTMDTPEQLANASLEMRVTACTAPST